MAGERRAAKRAAGEAAVETVDDGDVVGLGTGSTAAHAIRALGRAVDAGLDVRGVPTSYGARDLAVEAGVPLADPAAVDVDVAIDGADQVAGGDLLKGGGASHVRERIVDASADRFVVVVDPSKETDRLDEPVPIAVVPTARRSATAAIRGLGGEPALREATAKSGPVVTDDGNLVLDADFGAIGDTAALADDLDGVPGVVGHGLFVGLADVILIGQPDGSVERRTLGEGD